MGGGGRTTFRLTEAHTEVVKNDVEAVADSWSGVWEIWLLDAWDAVQEVTHEVWIKIARVVKEVVLEKRQTGKELWSSFFRMRCGR